MSEITCFMVEPTERASRWLRRFVFNSSCSSRTGIHDAQVAIEEAPLVRTERGTFCVNPMEWPHDDPRWPTHCACGYEFGENDEWQLNYHPIYRRPDTGEEFTLGLHQTPPGAMWYADWSWHKGPDGRCLVVMTPGGEWMIDAPSSGGNPWTRTGTPPLVTANPSILIPGHYHGWLRDGKLVEC